MTEEEKKQLEEQQETTTTQEGQEEQAVVTEQPAYTAPQREPAQLRNWYETLFRQDNAGEEAEISDEQRRKMARRERAERVIAGLGDIGTHIANIAFAGKGATPAKPTTTMSANIDNSWQRYNQDIEQRRKAYRQGLNAARQMDYRQYLEDRKYNLSLDREERLRWQQEHKYDLDKLREAKTKAEIARIEKRTPAEIAVLEQQAAYWEARANESQARADGKIPIKSTSGRSNGGGSKSTNSEKSFLGKSYNNKGEYMDILNAYAKEFGIPTTYKRYGRETRVDEYLLRQRVIEEYNKKYGDAGGETTSNQSTNNTTSKGKGY